MDPAQDVRARGPGPPSRPRAPAARVVDQGGDQDAGNDREGLAETRGQNDGQQLRLVAHLAERDDAGGDEEGFHEISKGRRTQMTARHPRPVPEAVWSKVLPGVGAARAMVVRTKYVDASPCVAQGGYSPMTGEPRLYRAVSAHQEHPYIAGGDDGRLRLSNPRWSLAQNSNSACARSVCFGDASLTPNRTPALYLIVWWIADFDAAEQRRSCDVCLLFSTAPSHSTGRTLPKPCTPASRAGCPTVFQLPLVAEFGTLGFADPDALLDQ